MLELKLPMERWQLVDLIQSMLKNYQGDWPEEKIRLQVPLSEHPFGLPIPASQITNRRILLFEFPGYTKPSVRAMAAVVGSQLKYMGREHAQNYYLRVIECPAGERDGFVACDLFFEFGGLATIYIVGGVNNYSGEGGSGGRTLENLFAFASAVSGLPIQRVRLPQKEGSIMQQRVIDAYNEWEKKERA